MLTGFGNYLLELVMKKIIFWKMNIKYEFILRRLHIFSKTKWQNDFFFKLWKILPLR